MEKKIDTLIAATEKLSERVTDAEAKQKKAEDERTTAIATGAPANGGNFRPVSSINSDEQRALRYFGAGHVKDLLNVNTMDPRFKHVPRELKHLVVELKSDFDISRVMQQMFYGEQRDRSVGDKDQMGHVKGILDGNHFGKNVLAPKLKAFGTGVATEGAEWVPTGLSSSFIEEFELTREVAARFPSLNMPTNPFELPVQDSVTTARIQAESGVISGANFNTSKLTFSATKLAEHTILPEELNEDSAPGILALSRSETVEAIGRAIEKAILNGDTAGTHQDSDVTAAEDAQKAWDGLRKLAIANSATVDFTNAAVTTTLLRSMRTAMGKYGVNVRDLCWKVPAKVYNQMLDLPEVTTVEKYGPQATILQGALAALDGIPIVISEFMRDDLNASGVEDGVTTDRSGLLLTNYRRFMLGVRRPIRIRAVPDPTPPNDRWLMVSWWRGDFQGHVQDAGETSVVYGINIA
jgi:hypothetical protein